jgi:flagellar hook protein FlgE
MQLVLQHQDYRTDVLTGTIKINSINPGVSFTIGDINEVSGTTETAGTKTTVTEAIAGTGKAAVKSAMEALRDAVAGTQQDVYGSTDILSDDNGTAITFTTGDTISYTIGTTTVTSSSTATSYATAMSDLITKINSDANLSTQVEAKNINGKLVIESKATGAEFSGIMKFIDASAAKTYTKEKNLDLSGNSGAGAEFMEIVSTVDQTSSKNSLQLKLDSLGLTDSSFGEFSVDGSGIITMKQDGVDYAIGQIAIAQFNNNIELEAVGDNLLSKTKESGDPIYSINNDNGVSVEGETLELSTADLSESLVNLMVFQRAFEANAKTITTADEILTTLIGLKR